MKQKDYNLLVDAREHKRIPYIQARCHTWGWDMEVKQLQYGDYVCGNTVIEYKTTLDFINSIMDGRLKKETIDQANHFPYHYVLIVGDVDSLSESGSPAIRTLEEIAKESR